LQLQRHLTDLIEKQRAAIGNSELAFAPLVVGAGSWLIFLLVACGSAMKSESK
jgi:hypothetical protein